MESHPGRAGHRAVQGNDEPAAAGAGSHEQISQGRRGLRAQGCVSACLGPDRAQRDPGMSWHFASPREIAHGENTCPLRGPDGPSASDAALTRRSSARSPGTRPPPRRPTSIKGKTITVVVGTRVGGSIGNTSLLVSRTLGKYIPGNPTVILRQMPGGAHLNATNHVFNVAEADGLTILGGNPAIAMAQLAKVKAVRFDVRKFHWLGSTGPDGTMFAIRASLPYKTFKDLQNAKDEIVVGTTGPGSNSHDVSDAAERIRRRQIQADRGLPGQWRHPAGARARRSGRLVGARDADPPIGGRGRRASAVARPQARSRDSSTCRWTRI